MDENYKKLKEETQKRMALPILKEALWRESLGLDKANIKTWQDLEEMEKAEITIEHDNVNILAIDISTDNDHSYFVVVDKRSMRIILQANKWHEVTEADVAVIAANVCPYSDARLIGCFFCLRTAKEFEAIDAGWTPYFWLSQSVYADYACPDCSATHLELDEASHEMKLKGSL